MNSRAFCVASILFLAAFTGFSADAAGPGWKLVWADEFDQPGLPDPRHWTYETGFIRNAEKQIYTANRMENARVENGLLVIEARKERFANPRYDAKAAAKAGAPATEPTRRSRDGNATVAEADYTSASVTTEGRAAWSHARIEVRAKLPGGRGMWPAIWMLGADRRTAGWPACGEIDIMEFVGHQPDTIHANVHMPLRHEGKLKEAEMTAKGMAATLHVPHPENDFHVYAVEWDAETMRFFVDDQLYLTYSNPHTGVKAWPFDQPFYLILNVAIGGTWGARKGIDDSIFPQRMYIDYVRVYERQ